MWHQCKNDRCGKGFQIDCSNYAQNQVIGEGECPFCTIKHHFCLECSYTTLSTTDSDRYYGSNGFKRMRQHLKRRHKAKLARKFDGTFQSDQENPFKRPRPTSEGENTNLFQVDACAIDGGDDHVSEADSEDEKEDGSSTNLFQVDAQVDACAIDGGDDHVGEADSEDEKEDGSNANLFEVDACALDEDDDHVGEADSEDDIQGDDECTDTPLIKANPRRDIWRAFLFDDDNNDTNNIDSDDDCPDLDRMSTGSQLSSDDTWDDSNCYTDTSLVEAAVSVAKKEIDNNDEIDAGAVLEFARILEESCELYELDDDLDFSLNCKEVADELDELDDLDGVDMPAKDHSLPFRAFADIFRYNMLGKKSDHVNQNALYFHQQSLVMSLTKNLNRIGGFRGLVGRANIQDRDNKTVLAKENEAEVVLRYIRIVNMLPRTACESFMSYEKGKLELFGPGINSRNVETVFPTCMSKLETFVGTSKHLGEHSIRKNFPVPKVFVLNNHACIDLEEAIRHIAGHCCGFGFAWDGRNGKPNHDGLNGTDAVCMMVNRVQHAMESKGIKQEDRSKTSVGWMYFWSDSFLNCFIKQKDNSVWLFTVTLCPPFEDRNRGDYTIVLAMGKSTEDHTKVIEYYYKRARDLIEGFDCYLGDTNEIGRVAFGLLFHSADRPERHSVAGTRTEGDYGRVTGSSFKEDVDMLPACTKCYKNHANQMAKGNWTEIVENKCAKCFNWSIDPTKEEQQTIPTNENYPKKSHEWDLKKWKTEKDWHLPEGRMPGMTKIGPIKLKNSELVAACVYAYVALREKAWSTPVMREYLRTCNIRDSLIAHIEYLAIRDRTRDDDAEEEDKRTARLEDLVPLLWLEDIDCFSEFRLPDMPMHAIAHGMVPDVMDFVHRILSHWKKFTEFTKFANVILSDIAMFRLDWCKPKPLPKAAWIGENSMGYMRLFSYLYGMYFLNAGLDQEKTRTVDDIKRFINAFQSLISVLMDTKVPKKNTIKNLMKLVMSTAHYAHTKYGSLSNKDVSSTSQKSKENKNETLPYLMVGADVLKLLNEFRVPLDSRLQSNRNKLEKLKKDQLISYSALTDNEKANIKNAKKAVIQDKVFRHMLGRPPALINPDEAIENTANETANVQLRPRLESEFLVHPNRISNTIDAEPTADEITNAESEGWTNPNTQQNNTNNRAVNGSKSSTERYLWQKGAWLSFLMNMENQCRYLGMPRLIW